MVNVLTAVGLGIVTFVIVVGVGITVLTRFGDSVGGAGNTSIQYGLTQLGSTGLLGWLPAVIAMVIGLLFIGSLAGKRNKY